MRRRLMRAILGFCFLLLPVVVQAQFTFLTNNGAITITAYTGPGGAVTIPDSTNGLPVTSIGDSAFENSSLTSVAISDGVFNIGDFAFDQCTNLTNVTFGKAVTNLGIGAFLLCSSLTTVTIPSGLINLGDAPFELCTSLTTIDVDTNNPAYTSIDGVLFTRDQRTLVQFPVGRSVTSYAIPNSVTAIGYCAFQGCVTLTSIAIPNNVASIGGWAFSVCVLTNITIGNSVTNLGQSAFAACSNLTSVTIDEGVTSIGPTAFYCCTSLTAVTVPNTVDDIGAGAFEGCTGLTNASIGDSVTNIEDGAFFDCSSLTTVTIPSRVANIGYGALGLCTNLTSVLFEGNAPVANSDAFLADAKATGYYLWGTTGWATFGALPTAIWQPQMEMALVETNQFGFTIKWASGQTIVIEASPTLAAPTWTPLQTNTLASGSIYFGDPNWTNYPSRFYRIRSP